MSSVTVRDRRRVHGEDFPDRNKGAAAENLDLALYRKFAAAGRAAFAASSAAAELVTRERNKLALLRSTWQGYMSGLDPHKIAFAEALINPDADPALRAKAAKSGIIGLRFPLGLDVEILALRANLTALEAEAKPEAERSQRLGELVENLRGFLRGRGLLAADGSAPVMVDRGHSSPESLNAFAAATETHPQESF